MSKVSPTQRALAELRKLGATCQVVERFCHFSKRRIDLFNFIDIVACVGPNIIGIQCTSGNGGHHANRVAKVKAEPKAVAWLKAGGLIEVWSFAKQGKRGDRKLWQLRKEEIVLSDLGAT